MKKKRLSLLTLCMLIALALVFPRFIAQAEPPIASWEVVDIDALSSEVALWVEENHQDHGLYVLPAGEVRYVLIAWGEKPTGGYQVTVSDVEQTATESIRMTANLTSPGPEDIVTQALTYPYQLVALEAGEETIIVNFTGSPWITHQLGSASDDDPVVIMKAAGAEDQVVPNPLIVWGKAQVYEATFKLVVEDGHHHLSEDMVMVADGAPAWTEFAVAMTLSSYSSPYGTVIALVEDAQDGSWREVAQLPVAFGAASLPFADVQKHWAEASIRRGIVAGFINGYPDGTFRPEGLVTRAEFFKMLVASQLGNQPLPDSSTEIPFDDAKNHWVADYLRWALDAGWFAIEGDFFGYNMGPDQIITRQEMALMIGHVTGAVAPTQPVSFTDANTIDELLAPYVAAATERGLLLGYPDGTFRPLAGLKRSESVTVVWRVARALASDIDHSTHIFTYTFNEDAQGWTGDFTDLWVGYDEDMFELTFAHAALPEELESADHALMISGNNRSDDLFMYVKKGLTSANGIEANTTYRITFEVQFATDAPAGAVGIGGPPGEAVWVKVGAADVEPVPVIIMEASTPFYVLNVDKGRQNEDGENALRIGDVAKVECDQFGVYELKTLDNRSAPLEISSDSQGNLWIFVGTDSGFEGKTTLYYNWIEVRLEKVE